MLLWTLEAARQSKYLTDFAVCSDDADILNLAEPHERFLESEVPDLRTRMVSLHKVIAGMEQWKQSAYDYIVDIRATCPLKTTQDIDGAIQLLISSGADSVIGVTQLWDHHPARAKWLDERGWIHDFYPEPADGLRQNLTPRAYVRNGAIYAYRRDALMGENGKLFGHEFSVGYEMPAERSVNIDTPLDWDLAELLMQRRGAK